MSRCHLKLQRIWRKTWETHLDPTSFVTTLALGAQGCLASLVLRHLQITRVAVPKKGQSETRQNFFGPSNDPSFTNPKGQKDPKSVCLALWGVCFLHLRQYLRVTITVYPVASRVSSCSTRFSWRSSVSEFISPCKVATGCPFPIQHYSSIIPAPRKPELVRNGTSSTRFTHTARSHPRDVFLVFGMFLRTAVCKDWDGSICPVFLVTVPYSHISCQQCCSTKGHHDEIPRSVLFKNTGVQEGC